MSDESGPAFPTTTGYFEDRDGNKCVEGSNGITKRDYFAAKAMQTLIAHEGSEILYSAETGALLLIAEKSYKMADAMLAERSRGE